MNKIVLSAVLCALAAGPALAMHPLMTEDTGVLGKGARQLELPFEHAVAAGSPDSYTNELGPVISYGLNDKTDLLVSLPWGGYNSGGNKESGLGDMAVEAKILLAEKYGWGWMLKPGFSLPTGDEDKGLGAGKSQQWLKGVAGRTFGKLEVYANLGWYNNANDAGEEKSLLSASAAGLYEVLPGLKLALDLATETNADKSADEHPLEGMAAAVWAVNNDLDLSAGYKRGLNDAAEGHALLLGATYRF
jgi:hypothetical protein